MRKKIFVMIAIFALGSTLFVNGVMASGEINLVTDSWSSKNIRQNKGGYIDLSYTNNGGNQIRVLFVAVHFEWEDEDAYYYCEDYSADPQYIASGQTEETRLRFNVESEIEIGSYSYYFVIQYEEKDIFRWSSEEFVSETEYDFTVLEKDRDGDGVGDSEDAFPDNPDESKDADKDGVGDNQDAFPNDPLEHTDSDGDKNKWVEEKDITSFVTDNIVVIVGVVGILAIIIVIFIVLIFLMNRAKGNKNKQKKKSELKKMSQPKKKSEISSSSKRIKMCPYCGEKLDFEKTPKYCPYCEEEIIKKWQ